MRISQLSDRTGVSIPTLKYYLREGLLHAGEAHGATRADYDESHVDRVRLVRTLVDVGRLSIERVREVVQVLDAPPASRHELLGAAHEALRPAASPTQPTPETVARVRSLGPDGCEHSPAGKQLAQALTAAETAGWHVDDSTLSTWQRAMRTVAETDVAPELGTATPDEALRYAIVGTVLTDPVLLALRRVAQEAVSAERLAEADPAGRSGRAKGPDGIPATR
ncbi:MerR family transcriptional regulator [Terrabacter aeriphilus]|uniref:MerR family transcriptional regulator n=1 Tax=Terrabacter aeriphilus TaxID=515662 RepID=A0ABP9JC14_9MICO